MAKLSQRVAKQRDKMNAKIKKYGLDMTPSTPLDRIQRQWKNTSLEKEKRRRVDPNDKAANKAVGTKFLDKMKNMSRDRNAQYEITKPKETVEKNGKKIINLDNTSEENELPIPSAQSSNWQRDDVEDKKPKRKRAILIPHKFN